MRELIHRLVNHPATARKFLAALLGALVVAMTEGLLPEAVNGWATVVAAFGTALGVYYAPNSKEPVAEE